MATKTCEIEGCGGRAVSSRNGISVCDRCDVDWCSAGAWIAVYFGGRWHGVIGATYDAYVADAHPGLRPKEG
jgi:hypothetical protein